MASDPTDLIRAVDEVHKPVRPRYFDAGDLVCDHDGETWPCEMRRLRDALAHRELHAAMNAELATETVRAELVQTRAALAEANATIERVRVLPTVAEWYVERSALDRVLDPGNHEQCPECGGWDGFHAYVSRSVTGGEGEMAYGGIMSSPCPRRALKGEDS